jgi:hypothetical protein
MSFNEGFQRSEEKKPQPQAYVDDYGYHAFDKVTRFEVIDHTTRVSEAEPRGRMFSDSYCMVELSFQDGDRTLKVFVTDREDKEKRPVTAS